MGGISRKLVLGALELGQQISQLAQYQAIENGIDTENDVDHNSRVALRCETGVADLTHPDYGLLAPRVGAIVPSLLLLAIFFRCILKNSDRRCFKDSSEDCEILISTNTRPRPLRVVEILHEATHREVITSGSPMISSADPPPEYTVTSISEPHGEPINLISLLPPVYGSESNLSTALPVYGSLPNVSSSIPFNLNSIITSLDLLPEFLIIPPPPTYEQAQATRNNAF